MTELQEIRDAQTEILQRITSIEAVVARQGDLCPHRELLARSANNIKRMSDMEQVVNDLRLEVAKISVKAGAIAGVFAGIGGAVGTAMLLKAFGL